MPGMDKCSVMYFRSERNSASLSALQAYYALPLINIPLITIVFLNEGNILHRSHAPGLKVFKTRRDRHDACCDHKILVELIFVLVARVFYL